MCLSRPIMKIIRDDGKDGRFITQLGGLALYHDAVVPFGDLELAVIIGQHHLATSNMNPQSIRWIKHSDIFCASYTKGGNRGLELVLLVLAAANRAGHCAQPAFEQSEHQGPLLSILIKIFLDSK